MTAVSSSDSSLPPGLLKPRILIWVAGRAFKSAFEDNCFNIAKAAAFSSALSIFPTLVLVAAVLFHGDAAETVEDISLALGEVMPPGVHGLLTRYLTVPAGGSANWLWFAAGVAVMASAQWIISLLESFRAAYRLPRAWSFWKEQGVAIGLVFLVAIPCTLATGALLFGRVIENWLILEFGEPFWLGTLVRLSRTTLVVATITLGLGILYHVGPSREQRWSGVWPGALFATLLWFVSTLFFAFYMQNLARYRDVYGAVTTMIVFLMWMYFVNCIIMIGCEFNAESERLRTAIQWEQQQAVRA